VARDRKRAKQRRVRGAAAVRGAKGADSTTPPVRADVPGSLGHASADADEFDAALIRGASGVTATPDTDTDIEVELTNGNAPQASDQLESRDELQPSAGGPGRGGAGDSGGGSGGSGGGGGGEVERPSGAPLRGGNRAIGFLAASWAELQRVQWPDRRQVSQATAVVLGFVAIAGAYLGLADYVAKEIVEFIL
jgi:preprotein translocase subunit SecE